MGVPRLYKWLVENFPKNIYNFPINSRINWNNLPLFDEGKQVDNFYIDGVSIVHQFAGRVFKYGDCALKKDEEDEYEHLSYKDKCNMVYLLSIEYIIELIKTVNPKYLVYVSFDGVAPLAKQGQQRQRRFLAAKGRAESRTIFDSNTITAGSSFTYNFCLYAKYTLIQRVANDSFFKNLKVLYSSSNVPGEGEHKIMDYIRLISKQNNGGRHVLYGPDGDLIMLALCTHRKDFWIIRENFFERNKFDVVDMGSIYHKLVEDLSLKKMHCDSHNIIHDFVLIGFFLGNDFLPKIQMVDMLEKGLETFLSKYKKIKEERSIEYEWTLTRNGRIIAGNFQHFINTLAGLEKYFLMSQITINVDKEKFINHTLLDSCKINKDTNERNFDYQLYDQLYTTRKFDNLSPDKVVDQYFCGLQWVLCYYIKGCPDWQWIYPVHYAPLMKHMSSAIRDSRFKHVNFINNTAMSPFRQMMCVIPPLSKNILHRDLRFVYDHPSLQEYYPASFKVDYEGKKQEWQGVAVLPFIDQKNMDNVYLQVSEKFENHKENRIKQNILITYTENNLINYKSKYGILEDIPVTIKDVNY